MISPVGLESWEVVALAGILAASAIAISSCIGATLAWFVFREKKVAHATIVAAALVRDAHPAVETRKPEFVSMSG